MLDLNSHNLQYTWFHEMHWSGLYPILTGRGDYGVEIQQWNTAVQEGSANKQNIYSGGGCCQQELSTDMR